MFLLHTVLQIQVNNDDLQNDDTRWDKKQITLGGEFCGQTNFDTDFPSENKDIVRKPIPVAISFD